MVNIRKAIEFVKNHGNEIEKNRLNSVLLGKPAPDAAQKSLIQMQNSDGGFSYWNEEFSTVSDTIYILSWIDDLNLRSGEMVERAFEFLISHQKSDGGWDEVTPKSKLNDSSTLIPGEAETRVFLTAFCAHWFVRFGRAEPPGAKGSPLKFLQSHRDPSGLIYNDLQTTWDSLVLFSYPPGVKSKLFKDTIDVIEKRFSPDNWEGSKIAYLLCCLRDSGLEAYHPFVNLCIDELIQKQREDGSWDSEYGDDHATDATIVALHALKHYGVV